MINNACNCLMMIEPENEATLSIEDELTDKAKELWEVRTGGGNSPEELKLRFRGCRTCICGETSDNIDWKINGVTTNSLLIHYIQCHREEIPESEIVKLRMLHGNLFPNMI
jgi:hypothetical protein